MSKYGEGTMGPAKPVEKVKIGVFDSGAGGLSVAQAIEAALPDYDIVYAEDKIHIPYGNKPPQKVHGYVLPILQDLIDHGCKIIVIACNTVTTTMIGTLRQELSVPLIGMEPMVKPAAELTKSGVIAVCATPSTLASKRYAFLKQTYASGVKVIEPDCSDWTKLIENNQIDQHHIVQQIDGACRQGADVIVLGCTHYHWIEDQIKKVAAGRAQVIQPEHAVVEQLKRVIAQTV